MEKHEPVQSYGAYVVIIRLEDPSGVYDDMCLFPEVLDENKHVIRFTQDINKALRWANKNMDEICNVTSDMSLLFPFGNVVIRPVTVTEYQYMTIEFD